VFRVPETYLRPRYAHLFFVAESSSLHSVILSERVSWYKTISNNVISRTDDKIWECCIAVKFWHTRIDKIVMWNIINDLWRWKSSSSAAGYAAVLKQNAELWIPSQMYTSVLLVKMYDRLQQNQEQLQLSPHSELTAWSRTLQIQRGYAPYFVTAANTN
jgi:hypothetical protein